MIRPRPVRPSHGKVSRAASAFGGRGSGPTRTTVCAQRTTAFLVSREEEPKPPRRVPFGFIPGHTVTQITLEGPAS